ncbi:MAG TPA: hypothetical protein V6C85_35910 [Allocoleopsis sp.]
MLKSESSDFNFLVAISVPLKKAATQFFQSIAPNQIAPISLSAVLGLTGVSWLVVEAIAPQHAHAYTARSSITLSHQPNESFPGFLRRAEAVARAAAQRSFDRDILVTDVAVTVLGQNEGAIVPLLLLRVSRQSWRSRPDPQSWISYFPNTQSLLGIQEPTVASETQEAPTTPPTNAPQQPPQGAPTKQPPGAPTVIELPGGNRRVIPIPNATPAPQAAPGTQATPVNPANPSPQTTPNNQIPQIPGAPIQRIPANSSTPLPPPPATP